MALEDRAAGTGIEMVQGKDLSPGCWQALTPRSLLPRSPLRIKVLGFATSQSWGANPSPLAPFTCRKLSPMTWGEEFVVKFTLQWHFGFLDEGFLCLALAVQPVPKLVSVPTGHGGQHCALGMD